MVNQVRFQSHRYPSKTYTIGSKQVARIPKFKIFRETYTIEREMSDDRKEDEEIGESGEISIKVPSGSSKSKKSDKKKKKSNNKRESKDDDEEVRFFFEESLSLSLSLHIFCHLLCFCVR